MPDEITPEARLAVAAAFAFAGPATNPGAWRVKFQEGLMRAGAAMNGHPAQEAQAMIDAQVFAGEYGGYDYEETSTRLLVKLRSDTGRDKGKDADGYERIRTDRTDNAFGKRMQQRLDEVPLGSKIVVWKVFEIMKNSEDAQKVRIMKHFEVISLNRDSASRPTQQGSPPTGAGKPDRSPAPAPTSSVALSEKWSGVVARVQALPNKVMVAFVKQCRDEKLNWMNPVEGDEERIEKILLEKEKG